MAITIEEARKYGYVFDGCRAWNKPENRSMLVQDAALATNPNVTVPVEFTAYIDPQVIEIMSAPRNARRLFAEEKKGDWTTPYSKFRVSEMVGGSQPYSDYADGGVSDVNNEWVSRAQYLFQTTITYGDFEVALSSEAKLNLAADKQKAAATRLDIDGNKFYLTGVANTGISGLFNDPNLPASIAAGSNGTSTKWADKKTVEIYNDILALFAQLSKQSNGLIDQNTPLKLCLSPNMNTYLGAATDFNVSVMDMIKKYFADIEVIPFPELGSLDGDETVFLIAPAVAGQPSATLGYSEKLRSGRIVPELSSFRQKFVSSTYGGIVYMPFAFASMTGIA
jgi:hypothetical protein